MENNQIKKSRIKKSLLIFALIFVAIGLIWLVFYAISELFLNSEENVSDYNSFYEVNYDENILNDSIYLTKARDVYYQEYGSGELITEENIQNLPISAKFFKKYFASIINGEYKDYSTFFTKKYFKVYKIPERFTMQKLYDINVDLYGSQKITEDGAEITVDTFIVRFKIMENNGTFRSDVGSNTIKPLVYELYTTGESVLINKIYFIQMKNE